MPALTDKRDIEGPIDRLLTCEEARCAGYGGAFAEGLHPGPRCW